MFHTFCLNTSVQCEFVLESCSYLLSSFPFETSCSCNSLSSQICFWLLENNFRVMVAACDTFRSGAVEQLRTHVKHLSSLHPPKREGGPQQVVLVEQGYGKDAAGIAMSAIHSGMYMRMYVHTHTHTHTLVTPFAVIHDCVIPLTCTYVARQQRIDVVLVDTAGRMQDNEPLMRALAKVCTL